MTENDIEKPVAEVWPQHARIVEVLTLSPWRYHGMGGALGLDWVQVEALCRMLGIGKRLRRQLLLDLQVVEQVALPLMNA